MRSRKWRGDPPPWRGTVAAKNRRRCRRRRRRRRAALCAASPNRMFPLYYRRTIVENLSRRSGRIGRTAVEPGSPRYAELVGKFWRVFFPARKQTASRKPRWNSAIRSLCANFRFVENKGLFPKAVSKTHVEYSPRYTQTRQFDWEYLNIWKYCKYSDRENKRDVSGIIVQSIFNQTVFLFFSNLFAIQPVVNNKL